MKKYWRWLKLVLAAGLLFLILRHVDLNQAVAMMKHADAGLLTAAWFTAFTTYALRALVLWLVAVPGSTLTPAYALRVNLIGAFFASVVPSAAANDVVRGWYLVPRFPTIAHAVAAVVAQRVLGLCALGVLVSIALMCVREAWGFASFAAVGAAGLAAYTAVRLGSAGRLGAIGRVLAQYRPRTPALMVALVVAFTALTLSIGVYTLAVRAMHLDLPATIVFLASALAIVGVFTPLTPAGLGVSEGTFVATVAYFGGDADAAFAVSLVVRLILVSISIVGGGVYLATPRANIT